MSLVPRLLAFWGLLSFGGIAAAAAAAPIVHGPFEITPVSKRISAGRFPNISSNPFERRDVTEFRVRFQGKPVADVHGNDAFWRVLRVEGAPRPALLLVTTSVHLLSDHSGQLQWQTLKTGGDGSGAESQWLDSEAGQPGSSVTYGIEALADPVEATRLSGGRWLRLGSSTVLDVQTLSVHKVEPWVPVRPGVPVTALSPEGAAARAFSPGGTQYALAASRNNNGVSGGFEYGLLVVDIPSGMAAEWRIDRRRMRFADARDFDAAWIAHHFVWKRDATGRERLEPRAAFTPWPWRGRLVQTGPGRWQYELLRVERGFMARMHDLALRLPNAQPNPAAAKAAAAGQGFELRVGPCRFHVSVHGRDGQPAERRLSVWVGDDDPALTAVCGAQVKNFAASVDKELATGRHDQWLLLD